MRMQGCPYKPGGASHVPYVLYATACVVFPQPMLFWTTWRYSSCVMSRIKKGVVCGIPKVSPPFCKEHPTRVGYAIFDKFFFFFFFLFCVVHTLSTLPFGTLGGALFRLSGSKGCRQGDQGIFSFPSAYAVEAITFFPNQEKHLITRQTKAENGMQGRMFCPAPGRVSTLDRPNAVDEKRRHFIRG